MACIGRSLGNDLLHPEISAKTILIIMARTTELGVPFPKYVERLRPQFISGVPSAVVGKRRIRLQVPPSKLDRALAKWLHGKKCGVSGLDDDMLLKMGGYMEF